MYSEYCVCVCAHLQPVIHCNLCKNGFFRSFYLLTHFQLYMSCYRGALATDVPPCGAEEDDITGILNVFCKHLAYDKSGKSDWK